MSSKSKSKQEEALQFLDDLDSMSGPAPPRSSEALPDNTTTKQAAPSAAGDAEALAFIDEITRKSTEISSRPHIERPLSRAGTPTLRKSTERFKVGGAPASSSSLAPSRSDSKANTPSPPPIPPTEDPSLSAQAGSSWGWGNVWSSASAAIQQAKQVVDEQVKYLPKNEQARKWGEGVMEYAKTAQLEKLGADFRRVGLSTLSDILNVVAPPISEHEVIQIWLSHDMIGHDGIENLVYRSMARIMEQVEGGDLVVTRGEESRPKDGSTTRELNSVEGYDAAMKLARANIDDVVKNTADKTKEPEPSATQSPTTQSHVYLRIQPFTSAHAPPADQEESAHEQPSKTQLQFLLLLIDPKHEVTRYAITGGVPTHWLDVWDKYEWVEDLVADSMRVGIEVIGQEYLVARMGWIRGERPGNTEGEQEAKESDTVVVESSA